MWLLAGAAVVVGFVLWERYHSRDKRLERAILAVPRVTLAATSSAVVRVTGRLVLAGPPLIAPLSGRPCAYYTVTVTSRGKKQEWTVAREVLGQPFILEDASGRALVHLDATSEVTLGLEGETSGNFDDASVVQRAFLERHGESSTTEFGFNRSLSYREGVLEAGELVTVVGVASREADPTPAQAARGYREQPTWMVLRGSATRPLLISDSAALAT